MLQREIRKDVRIESVAQWCRAAEMNADDRGDGIRILVKMLAPAHVCLRPYLNSAGKRNQREQNQLWQRLKNTAIQKMVVNYFHGYLLCNMAQMFRRGLSPSSIVELRKAKTPRTFSQFSGWPLSYSTVMRRPSSR